MGKTTQGPYFGSNGKTYTLNASVMAAGGEAEIYEVLTPGYPPLVAKIYKAGKATQEHHEKLKTMITTLPNPPEELAWPKDILYSDSKKKKFIGFVMPRVEQKKNLRDTYILDHRKNIKWSSFIRIARNLSAAVYNVHEIGQVIGDFNAENILVNDKRLNVTIVDTDSFHIRDKNTKKLYRCLVGKPEFIAPELIGVNFSTVIESKTYNENTDNYSLAILIFCLLFNGAHPFTCSPKNKRDYDKYQQEANIKTGLCAYFPEAVPVSLDIDIPLYSPGINWIPDYLRYLFYRAFVLGFKNPSERPKPEEWYQALKTLEKELRNCPTRKDHEYPIEASYCPWCETIKRFKTHTPSAHENTLAKRKQNTIGPRKSIPIVQNPVTSSPVSKQPVTSRSSLNAPLERIESNKTATKKQPVVRKLNFSKLSKIDNPFEYWKEYLTQVKEALPTIDTPKYTIKDVLSSQKKAQSKQFTVPAQPSTQPPQRIIGSSHVIVPPAPAYPIKNSTQTGQLTIATIASQPVSLPTPEDIEKIIENSTCAQKIAATIATRPLSLPTPDNIETLVENSTCAQNNAGMLESEETSMDSASTQRADINNGHYTDDIASLCAEISKNISTQQAPLKGPLSPVSNIPETEQDKNVTDGQKSEDIASLCAEISKNLSTQQAPLEIPLPSVSNISETEQDKNVTDGQKSEDIASLCAEISKSLPSQLIPSEISRTHDSTLPKPTQSTDVTEDHINDDITSLSDGISKDVPSPSVPLKIPMPPFSSIPETEQSTKVFEGNNSNDEHDEIKRICAEIAKDIEELSKNRQQKTTQSSISKSQNQPDSTSDNSSNLKNETEKVTSTEWETQSVVISADSPKSQEIISDTNDIGETTASTTKRENISDISSTDKIRDKITDTTPKPSKNPHASKKSKRKRVLAIIVVCLVILIAVAVGVGVINSTSAEKLVATEEAITYTISLNSSPSNATIHVNGNLLDAQTPMSLTTSEIGEYTISLSKDGYIPETQKIKIMPGITEYQLNFNLKNVPEPTGSLRINGDTGYVIYLNGTELGTLGPSGSEEFDGIKSGTYDLTIESGNNNKHTMKITIEPDKVNDISIGLAKK